MTVQDEILAAIRAHGPMTTNEIAAVTHRPRTSIAHAASLLRSAGKVASHNEIPGHRGGQPMIVWGLPRPAPVCVLVGWITGELFRGAA